MNFCGIICEFNPFHRGHEYIISEAKRQTNLPVLCLMSGDFVQRGIPAIQEKYVRAENAVKCGATAVFELPEIYACSNAENFALGAVKTLSKLGATHIAFGIENTDIETLKKAALLKYENSERFVNCFKNEIENGINYNTALKRSIAKSIDNPLLPEILSKPNNILAIEYLTAMLKLGSKMQVVAVERTDRGYNSETSVGNYLSAGAIRKLISENKPFEQFIPENTTIKKVFDKDCENKLNTIKLLAIRESTPKKMSKLYDYNEGIEYRIIDSAKNNLLFEDVKNNIITPRYRKQRVEKLLTYPILKITKSIVKMAEHSKPVCKLLAINKREKEILRNFDKKKISIIVTNADYAKLNKNQKKIIEIDLRASMIYQTIMEENCNIDKKNGTLFV